MFNQFLREQGYGEKWSNSIYPLMKRTLIGKIIEKVCIKSKVNHFILLRLVEIQEKDDSFDFPINFRYPVG